MSDESKINIDQELKRFASERRRDIADPIIMPGPVRHFLHGELQRQLRRTAAAKSEEGGWWRSFWPGFVWVASGVALVVLCAMVWWQYQRPAGDFAVKRGLQTNFPLLAKSQNPAELREETVNNRMAGEILAEKAAPPPSVDLAQLQAVESPVALDQTQSAASSASSNTRSPERLMVPDGVALAPSQKDSTEVEARTLTEAVAPPATSTLSAQPVGARDSYRMRSVVAAAREPAEFFNVVPPQPTQTIQNGQRFIQTGLLRSLRRNFNSPPRPKVLNDFRVGQVGQRLEVVDADGSVYEGPVPDTGNQGTAANNEVRLQVSGINRTLNQRVRLDGRLLVTNNNLLLPFGNNGAVASSNNLQFLLNNSLIRGQATIGERTRVEVDAVPVAPLTNETGPQ